jgi:hypothetical protein
MYRIDQINLSLYFYFFPLLILFQSITCCSYFVSTSIEGVLGGLADPIATLRAPPWRDPARASFRGLPSVHPGKGLTGDLHRSDWWAKIWPVPSQRCYSEPLCVCCWPYTCATATDGKSRCRERLHPLAPPLSLLIPLRPAVPHVAAARGNWYLGKEHAACSSTPPLQQPPPRRPRKVRRPAQNRGSRKRSGCVARTTSSRLRASRPRKSSRLSPLYP